MPQDETTTATTPDAIAAEDAGGAADEIAAEPGHGPAAPAPAPRRDRLPLLMRLYGLYNLVTGGIVLVIAGLVVFALVSTGAHVLDGSHDVTLTLVLSILQVVLFVFTSGVSVAFGVSLLRGRRRHAAQFAYGLIALNAAALVFDIMLHGAVENVVGSAVHFIILIFIASTVDPTLLEERRRERLARDAELEREARAGTLGRAKGDRGFIELDFFNLFWVFVVCCVLGLVIEVVYHMVVVDPGVYQDRAGMLFGPFSPIYGFGALLMTVALNRFYKASPVIVFLVSAVIGGLFEAAVSWFMQVGFGAVAWDYAGMSLFGIPDPVAVVFQGRTATPFMAMWGALGLVWIRLCLPRLLKLINLIPWKLRYSVTAVCATLMIVNGIMTLQALECWYERESGIAPSSPIERFYARDFDDAYMAHRFQSMTITPRDSARVPEA